MGYFDFEWSIQLGRPFFLYEFTVDSTVYRFTNQAKNITYNGNEYLSTAIKHSEVKQSSEISKNSITITMPIELDFVNLFKGLPTDGVITVTVFRLHNADPDTEAQVYWKGRKASHSFEEQTIEIKCESVFTSLRKTGVRSRYQRTCRHSLYGTMCKVNKADYAVAGTISAVSGYQLTISEASALTDGWFNGGFLVLPDGSMRAITSHLGSTIEINRASRYLKENIASGNIAVTLYPGCDRTLSTCKNKFNNVLNNGGFKWIPDTSPYGSSII